MKKLVVTLVTATSVSACGTWSPWGGPTELSRIPPDAVVYQCEGGKRLPVRFDEGGKSVMVIFPEREFRLDQIDGTRYGNGRTTFDADENGAWLEEGQSRLYSACTKQ